VVNIVEYKEPIAWAVLAMFYIAIVVPLVGAILDKRYDNYQNNFVSGLLIHIVVAVVGGTCAALYWALGVVL
jgi:uncharacterized membrane protein